MCPGNHDICPGSTPFGEFNRIAWQLTHDDTVSFSMDSRVTRHTVAGTDFILVNSAYHGDHEYGKVDSVALEGALRGCTCPQRVLALHHSLIPLSDRDLSTTRNAYAVIRLALEHEVSLILHGHSHRQSVVTLCGPTLCHVVGVGSLLLPPVTNTNNQFNLLRIENGTVDAGYAYRLVADASPGPDHPTFQQAPLPLARIGEST
jgi:3',5'-cyclic AMP phosphodiesterase CpdA